MKKSLIALAVLAASGAAMAQSSVTLFGVVDAAIRYVDADTVAGKGGGSQWSLADSGYNSSRLGFRGTEDLGGGLNASFWLEAGINNDNGTGDATNTNNSAGGTSTGNGLTFNRRSTVSLAGSWGELRLGRDYVPFFWNTTIFDPFGTNGVGAVTAFTTAGLGAITGGLNVTAVRASNSIGYFMPNMSGFYGQAMYAMGEQSDSVNGVSNPDKSNGNVASFRVGYANGPVDVALSYGATTYAPSRQYEVWNIGASWNFGVFKLLGLANWENAEAPASSLYAGQTLASKTYMIGATMPLGAGELKGSYTFSNTDYDLLDGSMFAIGYVYNLSKRTALYTTASFIDNKGKAGVYTIGSGTPSPGNNGNQMGFDFGVKHTF